MPHVTDHEMELALDLKPEDDQWSTLEAHGWHLVDAHAVASTPLDYQRYIQESFGEFSCAKPSYARLETAC